MDAPDEWLPREGACSCHTKPGLQTDWFFSRSRSDICFQMLGADLFCLLNPLELRTGLTCGLAQIGEICG